MRFVMKIFILVFFIFYSALGSRLNVYNNKLVKNYFSENRFNCNVDDSLPKVLRVLTAKKFGGIEMQTINAYKYFLDKGYNINLLVVDGSGINEQLLTSKLPFSSISQKNNLKIALEKMYLKNHFDIIHCHKGNEYSIVKSFSKEYGISCIAHYHSHAIPKPALFMGFDAFVASSPNVFNFMQKANKKYDLGIKYIEFIHPPHDEGRFLNFQPTETKVDFFRKNFNVYIDNHPVICMIANLFKYKNHELLLNAIANLIHEDKILVEIFLAGDEGDVSQASLKQLASRLRISEYVHFLGFTKLIPELLYYSDMKVLCSKKEAFGIVLMEAALMKKPIILSRSADMAGLLIQHEKTGLLCDSSDSRDLARQIRILIQNPAFAKTLGENAFDIATKEFSNKAALDKFEKLYKNLYADMTCN